MTRAGWTVLATLLLVFSMHILRTCCVVNATKVLVLLPRKKGTFYYPFGMEKAGAAGRPKTNYMYFLYDNEKKETVHLKLLQKYKNVFKNANFG